MYLNQIPQFSVITWHSDVRVRPEAWEEGMVPHQPLPAVLALYLHVDDISSSGGDKALSLVLALAPQNKR